MGNVFSLDLFYHPLDDDKITYDIGKDMGAGGDYLEHKKEMDEIHRKFNQKCKVDQQQIINQKIEKLNETSETEYAKRYPLWSAEEIRDLKLQFFLYEIHRDGLTDFKMAKDLKRFSERKDTIQRIAEFNSIMSSQCHKMDFEDFLVLLTFVSPRRENGFITTTGSSFNPEADENVMDFDNLFFSKKNQ